ncbi:1-aminocyclopropane-1-carboxylate deaminase/D-cysteine desulfhydrase [Flavobacterium humi]|uniref:1-aminocyclopropane-1-carboxylate deaminase/D-cysteine desulfhydrase n=1 Tax=Flavobacterium humi TaxID=2562683 RepID=A0A4Z0L6V2_9FLAO|nr:pyridoxal-phosphate dependent enzyme [Flavobacterium humi]TGD56894.1 1-aminocyclopropane-1-carboxylate deaminase/D-cysteine desulfhydrase [Flavobacterium humi]
MEVYNQNIKLGNSQITLSVKREDLLHPFVSGNKFRKLKYNLEKAGELGYERLVTFGGAFSNHIAAVAFACQEAKMECVGIIRGEELSAKIEENPTLSFAQKCGMQFEFVSRSAYQEKDSAAFISDVEKKYGRHYLLPEGGTNALAIKGCEEILTEEDAGFDIICCAVGTGGTISGIINSAGPHQKVIGFPALKGDFLTDEIRKFAKNQHWELCTDYHFGGYGKVTPELIGFINRFYEQTGIPLDPVYTGKMVFGVMDLIQKGYFTEHSKILMIHTGGLQGIRGMNQMLEKKKMTKILFDE